MNQRVRQCDLAEKLGVDKSTVSLALRGDPRIPVETRQRVAAMAEKMGYRPDPGLTMLARHRWANQTRNRGVTIAYLVQKKKPQIDRQRLHLAAARKRAEERGYNLVEFDLSAYASGAIASKVLSNRGIRGVILPAMPLEMDPDLNGFRWDQFTVVGCSVGWLRTSFHIVTPDKFEGTRLAWREVIKRGYQRIGAALFRHEPVAVDDYARLGASYAEQLEGVPAERRLPFLRSRMEDRDAFLAWVKKHRPDAVVSFISYSPYRWLVDAGYRIPEDIGFASLHAWPEEAIAGVSVRAEDVARSAVDLLISQMLDNCWGVPKAQQVLLLQPSWHEGTTLPIRAGIANPVAAKSRQVDSAAGRVRRRSHQRRLIA